MTVQAQPLTLDAVIVRGDGQVSTVVDDKAVLMSVDNGKYYHMEEVGTRIWNLIESPVSVNALCRSVMEEFEVDGPTCEADVLALLSKLLEYDLIQVVPSK
jgi:hypothetical protein